MTIKNRRFHPCSPPQSIGVYTSISIFPKKKINKDKTLTSFSSPQPSPTGEGVRDKCKLLLLIGYKLV